MDEDIEIRKVAVEPRRSIPAIAMTAIVMALVLAAIIFVQKYANAPAGQTPAAPQTDVR